MTKHLVLFSLLFLGFLPFAHAGKVVNVKGKKIYVVFDASEGGTFAEGDLFTLTDSAGKKRALIQIKKVKGVKAIAELKKGKAEKGYATVFKSEGGKKGPLADSAEESGGSMTTGNFGGTKTRWGAMFGYGVAKQDVDQGSAFPTSSETGSSMSVKGAYDYPLLQSVTLRALGGVEMMSVSGQGVPTGKLAQTTVGTDITYLSLDGIAKWSFTHTTSMNFYLFGGGGFLYPLTKSSDIIKEDTIKSLMVGEVGLGMEFRWGRWIVPIDGTYYVFPSAGDAKTSLYGVRFGILF